MFVRTQTNGSRTYLLIVDNRWVNGKVKQHVLLRLGRLDELLASGRLDSLIQALGRFSEKLAVLGAHAGGDSITHPEVALKWRPDGKITTLIPVPVQDSDEKPLVAKLLPTPGQTGPPPAVKPPLLPLGRLPRC